MPESLHYFPRDIIPPPGRLNNHEILDPSQSLEAVRRSDLSLGAKYLLQGLLQYGGGVKQFKGGIGLDYDSVFKRFFNTGYFKRSSQEMAFQIERTEANIILAPERSAIIPAAQIAHITNLPVLYLVKNGEKSDTTIIAEVDSYTGGGRDRIELDRKILSRVLAEMKGRLRGYMIDEMLDCGSMSMAVHDITEQAQSESFDMELVGIGSLMEKIYTGAADAVEKKTKIRPSSVVQFEDMGLNPFSWIKVAGVEGALTYFSAN